MPDDPTADDTTRDDGPDFELEPAVEALIDGDGDLLDDGTRHYEQDPNHLAQFARDAVHHVRVNAEPGLPGKGFAAEFDHHAPVARRATRAGVFGAQRWFSSPIW